MPHVFVTLLARGVTRDVILSAQGFAQTVTQLLQQAVAELMTEGIVDGFEVINVDDDERGASPNLIDAKRVHW